MERIIEIAHLIEYISKPNVSRENKASAVKSLRDDGYLTSEEALDLIIEYT